MSSASAFPRRPDDVDVAWLEGVLRAAGLLDGTRLVGCEPARVGTGQMGDSIRYVLRYDGAAPRAPRSVVCKFASSDPTSRATGVALRTYEVEVGFYREIARTVDIRTPACHFADIDLATGEFVLVLEDLAPCVQGDQLAGCTVEQAGLAMDELAKLHAPRWNDPALAAVEWLNRNGTEEAHAFGEMLLPPLLPGFVERYGHRLDPRHVEIGELLMQRIGRFLRDRPGPRAVQHGDYRLDNMLFGTADGGYPLAVVDWQTVVWGPPVFDAAYFLGAGLESDPRRTHERELLRRYYGGLTARGVTGYSWDECWRDYRRYAFGGFLMAIGASMMVVQTERGDEMFLTMLRRHGAQIVDLGSEEFLA
ncbi:MAG TPA: phosphotransferase [Candidatus Eisenbacteria bacterium]|nr:phosphotransferase [Candidatus Eisenbacteria bacterium]